MKSYSIFSILFLPFLGTLYGMNSEKTGLVPSALVKQLTYQGHPVAQARPLFNEFAIDKSIHNIPFPTFAAHYFWESDPMSWRNELNSQAIITAGNQFPSELLQEAQDAHHSKARSESTRKRNIIKKSSFSGRNHPYQQTSSVPVSNSSLGFGIQISPSYPAYNATRIGFGIQVSPSSCGNNNSIVNTDSLTNAPNAVTTREEMIKEITVNTWLTIYNNLPPKQKYKVDFALNAGKWHDVTKFFEKCCAHISQRKALEDKVALT